MPCPPRRAHLHRALARVVSWGALAGAVLLLFSACESPETARVLFAQLEANPNPIERVVYVGYPVRTHIAVHNTGTAPATFGETHLSSPGLSLHLPAGTVRPGAHLTGVLDIAPSVAGSIDRTWNLAPQDAAAVALRVHIDARTAPDCGQPKACHAVDFDAETGACITTALADGAPCGETNACLENAVCSAGQCVGAPVQCAAPQACLHAHCDAQLGCVYEPDDALCADGPLCTTQTCTLDRGCVQAQSPDGTVCRSEGCARLGLCAAGTCVDVASTDGLPCEDGDLCTTGDTCAGGTCVPGDGPAEGLGLSGAAVVPIGNVGRQEGPYVVRKTAARGVSAVLGTYRADTATHVVWRTPYTQGPAALACGPSDVTDGACRAAVFLTALHEMGAPDPLTGLRWRAETKPLGVFVGPLDADVGPQGIYVVHSEPPRALERRVLLYSRPWLADAEVLVLTPAPFSPAQLTVRAQPVGAGETYNVAIAAHAGRPARGHPPGNNTDDDASEQLLLDAHIWRVHGRDTLAGTHQIALALALPLPDALGAEPCGQVTGADFMIARAQSSTAELRLALRPVSACPQPPHGTAATWLDLAVSLNENRTARVLGLYVQELAFSVEPGEGTSGFGVVGPACQPGALDCPCTPETCPAHATWHDDGRTMVLPVDAKTARSTPVAVEGWYGMWLWTPTLAGVRAVLHTRQDAREQTHTRPLNARWDTRTQVATSVTRGVRAGRTTDGALLVQLAGCGLRDVPLSAQCHTDADCPASHVCGAPADCTADCTPRCMLPRSTTQACITDGHCADGMVCRPVACDVAPCPDTRICVAEAPQVCSTAASCPQDWSCETLPGVQPGLCTPPGGCWRNAHCAPGTQCITTANDRSAACFEAHCAGVCRTP